MSALASNPEGGVNGTESIPTTPEGFNALGCKLQAMGLVSRAISQYRKALKLTGNTHQKANFNMAICLCELARRQGFDGKDSIKRAFWKKATVHYKKVIGCESGQEDIMIEATSNLAVLQMNLGDLDEAHALVRRVLEETLNVSPERRRDARWNLNSILRRMGRKDEAIQRMRSGISAALAKSSERGHESVPCLNCDKLRECAGQAGGGGAGRIAVVCVKWGTKYGFDYVKNLCDGVKTHLSLPHDFYCLTDDLSSLSASGSEAYDIKGIQLETGWTGWWNKLCLFSKQSTLSKLDPRTTKVLYVDLDTIVTGSLDEIGGYGGPFAILSTDGLDNEGSDFSDGYNSSIVIFDVTKPAVVDLIESTIYRPLAHHFEVTHQFVHRLDHWLEMTVLAADLLQDLFPHQILEYTHDIVNGNNGKVPGNGRIVNFPLAPKPHQICDSHRWMRKDWGMK